MQLKKKILCNYDKTAGPGKPGDVVQVYFDYFLKSFEFVSNFFPTRRFEVLILNFQYEETRTFTTQSYITMQWMDERLKWRPEDFKGVQSTSTEIENVWVPDVSVYNS